MVVCDDGQPKNIPPCKIPKRNAPVAPSSGGIRPVKALKNEETTEPMMTAWANAREVLLRMKIKASSNPIGSRPPTIAAEKDALYKKEFLKYAKYFWSNPEVAKK